MASESNQRDIEVPAAEKDPVKPRPEVPADLEDRPAPEELTGRASKTEEDLGSLFGNEGGDHLSDGFKGGSGDEQARRET